MKTNKTIYKKITKEEAKNLYCKCRVIYVKYNNEMRKIRESGEYGSHAPIEVLFYRSIGYCKDSDFYTEWIPEWNIVHESDDENGNPTTWAMDITGTEYEEKLHSRFIWITKIDKNEYTIEINPYNLSEFVTKATCKTLSSAKRWVTMYLL